ncbi:MAG: DUF2141 domain-containing protein [Sphingobacteriia bacterium]|jgi:uncharacterized protein (DUF2141 family)
MIVLSLLYCLLALQPTPPPPAEGYSLHVDFRTSQAAGTLYITLFSKPQGWPDEAKQAYRTAKVPCGGQQTLHHFANLPAGSYALAAFQDLNGNGELDTNLFGVPTEPYGFSNNARGTLSAPNFGECEIKLRNQQKITITLK